MNCSLRRAATVSIIVWAVAACATAQLPPPGTGNEQPEQQQETPDPRAPPIGIDPPNQPSANQGSTPANPNTPWYEDPEWWQVLLIVAGTMVATFALMSERRAVRLTQRADVLIETINTSAPGPLERGTVVTVILKNFGPTRAHKVKWDARLAPEGADDGPPPPPTPVVVVAAGDTLPCAFGPLLLPVSTIHAINSGHVILRFECIVTYEDIFGHAHTTNVAGHWSPVGFVFVTDKNEGD